MNPEMGTGGGSLLMGMQKMIRKTSKRELTSSMGGRSDEWSARTVLIAYCLAFSLLTGGCGDLVHWEEVFRVRSPDGVVEAVLVASDAGATTAVGHQLYLVPAGGQPEEKWKQMNAYRASNIRVKWRDNDYLEVYYDTGKIFNFSNEWYLQPTKPYHTVEVRLIPTRLHSLPQY
ncbi:MAG: hypothetical protein HQL83_05755 [Magnetococcales bacterium]|nr:hypothetical protein [Magnetococcales bacterium]